MARDPEPDKSGKRDDDAPEAKPKPPEYPPPEDEFGGGDICSPEETPVAEDDAPLP